MALMFTTNIRSYLHPLMPHIQRKNPFFDGSAPFSSSLHDSLDHGQHQVLAFRDLEVNLTYDPKLFFSLLDYFLISDHRAFSLKLVR